MYQILCYSTMWHTSWQSKPTHTDSPIREYGALLTSAFQTPMDLHLKLTLVTLIVFTEDVRQSAWDNIVSCHQGATEARTWSFQRKCIGKHQLKSRADDKPGPVMVGMHIHCTYWINKLVCFLVRFYSRIWLESAIFTVVMKLLSDSKVWLCYSPIEL